MARQIKRARIDILNLALCAFFICAAAMVLTK